MAATGCSSGQPEKPPQLGETALVLHVCLRSEPDNSGPCTEDALSGCPAAVDRDVCLAIALDELAEFDAYAANPPATDAGLPVPALLAVATATLGMFAFVGWRVAKKTASANQRAFDDELPAVLAQGFHEAHGLDEYGIDTVGEVRRVLFRNGRVMIWLLESEHPSFAINALPPARYAVIRFDHQVPTGQLTPSRRHASGLADGLVSTFGAAADEVEFVRTLRSIVEPLPSNVALEAGGTAVVLRSIPAVKVIGKPPAPVSLVVLGEVAIRIAEELSSDQP